MNISRNDLLARLDSTGAVVIDNERLPQRLKRMAEWFFMRGECNTQAAIVTREALHELNNTGMLKFTP